MDVGSDELVFLVFGDHELLQDIMAFIVEVVYLEFESTLFQECLDCNIGCEQVRLCPSSQRLGEDFVGVVVVTRLECICFLCVDMTRKLPV